MNREYDDIGNPGIDTQFERDSINYRPEISFTPERIHASEYTKTAENSIAPDILIRPIIQDSWNEATAISKKIKDLELALNDKLKNDKVTINSSNLSAIELAAQKLGFSIKDNQLPFLVYKAAMESPDSYEKMIITDGYENYHSDVKGSLNAELYTDFIEIKQDWSMYMSFILKGLMKQFVEEKDLPTTLEQNDSAVTAIKEAEALLIGKLIKTEEAYQTTLKETKDAYLSPGGEDAFYKSSQENSVKKNELRALKRQIYSRTEIYSLIQEKTSSTNVMLSLINNTVDYNPFKGKTQEILIHLLNQYTSGQSIQNGLRKIQVLMKLAVDGKSEKVTNTKQDLRSVASLSNKARLGKELINGVHLRNQVFGEVQDLLESMDGVKEEEKVFDSFADHLVESIVYADKLYADQSLDFYKIHTYDSETRLGKLRQLIDKNSAREVYKLADLIINYASSNNNWPTKENLTQWVNQFMRSENLS